MYEPPGIEISGCEAVERFPALARLGDGWIWALRPTSRVEIWGSHFTPEIQFGIFIYRDGSASVIRMDWGQFTCQYSGALLPIITRTEQLIKQGPVH